MLAIQICYKRSLKLHTLSENMKVLRKEIICGVAKICGKNESSISGIGDSVCYSCSVSSLVIVTASLTAPNL